MRKCFLISICTAYFSFLAQAQDRQNQISLSPFSATDLGFGLGASYQYYVTPKIGIEMPLSMNWNLSSLLYGPAITDVYKSSVLRFMPNVKYYVVDKSRFRYGAGLGISYGMGWDELRDQNHKGTFHQLGAFIDNSVLLLNKSGVFGIGADLSLGYHFYDGIESQYQKYYDFENDFLLRLGFKFVFRF